MSILHRFWSLLIVNAKYIWARPRLAIASTVGWTLAVAFGMSIPLYADAIYTRTFLERVSVSGGENERTLVGYLFRFSGAAHGSKQWEDIQQVDTYLATEAAAALGLPQEFAVRYVQTSPFGLFPLSEHTFSRTRTPILWGSFGCLTDLAEHVHISEGRFPATSSTASIDQPVEVLVSQRLAERLGLQVGEGYTAYFSSDRAGAQGATALPLQIVGVWQPVDSADPYWFFDPTAFEERFLVSEGTFAGAVGGALHDEVYVAVWYLAMDGNRVQHQNTQALMDGGNEVHQRATTLLPGLELVSSPVGALRAYRSTKRVLTVLLYAFSVPIVGLMLVFIGLVSGLSVSQQHTEIAVLRSRGATARQVTNLVLLRGLLQAAVALPVGALAGVYLSQLMGRARGFLDFSLPRSDLSLRFDPGALQIGLIAIALALATLFFRTRKVAQDTIVTYRWEHGRTQRQPWWQRAGLDFLLLIPTAYGFHLLRTQGRIAQMASILQGDLVQDPLLFLVPSLGLLALTLLSLRILPLLMSGLAWIAGHTGSISFLMAVRHLARTPSSYAMPWVLLILTLSLSVFTATLGQTLNTHLHNEMYYAVGGDMQLIETGEAISAEVTSYLNSGQAADSGPQWLFVPVSEYQRLSGVRNATRIGEYSAYVETHQGRKQGKFLGVDRVEFPSVGWWRNDFASESLGALMNALAITPEGVLVPRAFMREQLLNIGDRLRLTVDTNGQINTIDLTVVGHFELFPTWYPTEGPLFVGNLDYLFQEAGGQFPYSVLIAAEPDIVYGELVDEGRTELGLRILDWRAPLLRIAQAQERPERRGLLGVLSIGFAAAGGLTVIGFMLYTLVSFEGRVVEFGVLRAIGLSSQSMSWVLAWELTLLLVLGCVAGTILGAGMGIVFIPYYQIGTATTGGIPPYTVEIAWSALYRVYLLFGVLFLMALGALIWAVRRMRLFQVIKMGGGA
jgi:putative ABC transport system permease protein